MFEIVNMYSVFVASVVAMGIGTLWYSPLLFGTQWRRLQNVPVSDQNFPASKMIIEFVSTLVTAFVLSLFTVLLPQTIYASIIFALVIWVGFYVTMLLSEVLWENKPFELFLLNAGVRAIILVSMTLILVLWR